MSRCLECPENEKCGGKKIVRCSCSAGSVRTGKGDAVSCQNCNSTGIVCKKT